MQTSRPIEHGYFAVTGFDLWGGDLDGQRGYSTFQETLIEVKKRINNDESKCGIIFRRKDKHYDFYIKSIHKTNPSKASNFVSYTNVFYGGRACSSKDQVKKESSSLAQYDYYMINKLDMWGADIEKENIKDSFEEALEAMKKTMNFDNTKCGVIYKQGHNNYTNYFKDIKRTDPSKSEYHQNSVTVLYGRTV